ncbi:anhydro-N-acetylmuramic acid kinase [Solirubrobacter soli]|uniref:anhydro-N-acetylmuramic acid kinase n=1 Tax=Solirubrobacter soli TaxID=363832 RepID=UPI0003FE8DCA|nr:anhydro-N-acetylmuramic acid kinase [Solirubrobacter soli]
MLVVGLMSGTSCDGIDAAVADLELDGDVVTLRCVGELSAPYPDDLRDEIEAALPPASTTLEAVCRLDTRIGQAFADLAERAVAQHGGDLVVSHGQTVFHAAHDGTLQLGQPAWIAERTGLPVVADLRARDIAAGGQGAPLVSLLDALILHGRPGRPAALNLGGIANLTVPPIAFDVGPANALLDAAARHFTGRAYDADGTLAAAGTVDQTLLDELLEDPYYARPAPKTTGKEHFHAHYVRYRGGAEDTLATLTALTARTVADAARRHGVTEVIASGGGVRNPTLMAALRRELDPIALTTSDALGLPAQAKEAYAFALLGFLTHHGVAGTIEQATGARHASVLGAVTPGAGALPAPRVVRLE